MEMHGQLVGKTLDGRRTARHGCSQKTGDGLFYGGEDVVRERF